MQPVQYLDGLHKGRYPAKAGETLGGRVGPGCLDEFDKQAGAQARVLLDDIERAQPYFRQWGRHLTRASPYFLAHASVGART